MALYKFRMIIITIIIIIIIIGTFIYLPTFQVAKDFALRVETASSSNEMMKKRH